MSRTVIKLGGSVLSDEKLRPGLIDQIRRLIVAGQELVLVHGGGKQIASLLDRLRIESRFHDGLRITDRSVRDVAQMVLAGQVGKDLVSELAAAGITAASLTGGDGSSFLAEKLMAEDGTDLGFVGKIVASDSRLIEAMLAAGILPVIACLALGRNDYEYYNINGDQMAAGVAGGCAAETLVFVTDVGGVMDSGKNLIVELTRDGMSDLLASGVAAGGMRPKLRACLEALDSGVGSIRIIGAADERSLLRALLTREPVGTRISSN